MFANLLLCDICVCTNTKLDANASLVWTLIYNTSNTMHTDNKFPYAQMHIQKRTHAIIPFLRLYSVFVLCCTCGVYGA